MRTYASLSAWELQQMGEVCMDLAGVTGLRGHIIIHFGGKNDSASKDAFQALEMEFMNRHL